MHRTEVEPATRQLAELLDVVGDAATDATERKRRPNDRGEANFIDDRQRLIDRSGETTCRHLDADLAHGIAKLQPILGNPDRLDGRPDELNAAFGQRTPLGQGNREVQRGLPSHGRQHRVRALLLDDRLRHFRRQRLDVGSVRHLRVGHDGGRVAVDEHHLETFGTERLARLRTRIVELARLPDHNRARADHEYSLDVSAFGHHNLVGSRR